MPLLTIALATLAVLALVLLIIRGPRARTADGVSGDADARWRRGMHVAAVIAPLAILVLVQWFVVRI